MKFSRPFPRQQKLRLTTLPQRRRGRCCSMRRGCWIWTAADGSKRLTSSRWKTGAKVWSEIFQGDAGIWFSLVHRIGLPPFLRQKLIRMFLQSKTKGGFNARLTDVTVPQLQHWLIASGHGQILKRGDPAWVISEWPIARGLRRAWNCAIGEFLPVDDQRWPVISIKG